MAHVVSAGIKIKKREGQCAHPSCETAIPDYFKGIKLPIGWGEISFRRATKNGPSQQHILVCPEHTLSFSERQASFDFRKKNFVRVAIESPFAGDIATNLRYLRKAMRYCLKRGEAPYASHALYTQDGVLDDNNPDERTLGIEAGLAWGEAAQKAVVYTDLGFSRGMEMGIERHTKNGIPVEKRELPGWKKE